MKSFFEVCENTREKLGRELHKKEIEFLRYTHKRYEQELRRSKNMKVLDK